MVVKFNVRGIRSLSKTLVNEHVQVLQDLDTPSFGESTVLVADPDGYAVLLAEPVETVH